MAKLHFKRKLILAGFIIALMSCCTACSPNGNIAKPPVSSNAVENPQAAGDNSKLPQSDSNRRQEEPENSQEPEPPSSSWYFENKDIEGNVIDFSEDGFTISPVITSEDESGGKEGVMQLPGEEDLDSLVKVSYSENVIFEVLRMDITSNTMISIETADKESVKKQSTVLIFGTCQDTGNWTADRVIITRWER